MGQLLNTVALNDFVSLVNIQWVSRQKKIDANAKQLFITEDLGFHTGESRRYKEIDVEEFASLKREGAAATKATVALGYEIDMTVRRFAKEIDITWEMRRFNKYPDVASKLTSLTDFGVKRMELDLTHRITFGTATSYTDMDGETVSTVVGDTLALFSAVHTLTESATTYSNIITGNPQFSKGAIEVAELQANTQILANDGGQREMTFNAIFTTNDPTQLNAIKRHIRSTTDDEQDNSGVVNVNLNKYEIVVLPRLATNNVGQYNSAKKNYWGLVAKGMGQAGWQAYLGMWEAPNMKTPAAGNNGEDFHTDDWTFGTRVAYGICTVTGRGILLSTGAGA